MTKFTLKRVPKEANADLDASKLLGSPVFPAGFIDEANLDEADYFVAQINCEQVKGDERFPRTGFIYIFINIDTMQPRVFYRDEEPAELIDDMFDAFDKGSCGDPTCLKMVFEGAEDSQSYLFGDIDMNLALDMSTSIDGKLTLLQIDALGLPEGKKKPLIFGDFGMGSGYWVFLIDEERLAKRDFDEVEFLEVES